MLTARVIYLFALGEEIDVLFSEAVPGATRVSRGAPLLGTANQSAANTQRMKVARMDSSSLRLARLLKAMLKY